MPVKNKNSDVIEDDINNLEEKLKIKSTECVKDKFQKMRNSKMDLITKIKIVKKECEEYIANETRKELKKLMKEI